MRIFLSLLLLFPQLCLSKQNWVVLGQMDYTWGYKTPYRIVVYAPYGVHQLDDIKNGLQVLKFELKWLSPVTTVDEVKEHFGQIIKTQFPDQESAQINSEIINKFTRKLPATKRLDIWSFIYSPDRGTDVFIGNNKIYSIIGSEVNRALYTAWLLPNPVTTAKLLNRLLKQG